MEVQFIFMALVVSLMFRFARPSDEIIKAIGEVNQGSGFRENFHNLFNSVMNSNSNEKNVNAYRNILELEAVKEQQAFDAMKEELLFARRQRNAYKHVGENTIAFKREIHENKNGSGTFTQLSEAVTRESCLEPSQPSDAPSLPVQSIYASFTSIEDKYIEHFGNDPRDHRYWVMVRDLYLEDGEPTLKKFCAEVHARAGKGSEHQVESVLLESKLLHFKNPKYSERFVDVLQCTVVQPTISTTSAFNRLLDEKSSVGPWHIVEGLQADCVHFVTTEPDTSQMFLREHVCGITKFKSTKR